MLLADVTLMNTHPRSVKHLQFELAAPVTQAGDTNSSEACSENMSPTTETAQMLFDSPRSVSSDCQYRIPRVMFPPALLHKVMLQLHLSS